MKTSHFNLISILALVAGIPCTVLGEAKPQTDLLADFPAAKKVVIPKMPAGKYKADWASLKEHSQVPEWFKDAKLGIYTHWGPTTVGAEGGKGGEQWYGRNIYNPKTKIFSIHKERFGEPKTFGFKDIIPKFTAKKFDADAWAKLFADSGAKFAGPVAVHHDNFAMWDSDITRWNSVDMGPGRDFTGELAESIRAHGMKFIATFHHSWSWNFFEKSYDYDAADPQWKDLYGEPHKKNTRPSERYLKQWLGMISEVVTKYEPEQIYFDFGLERTIPEEWQKRMFADYYNWAESKGKQVCVAHKHKNIHAHVGLLDFERGRADELTEFVWQTDTSVGPWFMHPNPAYKTPNQLVDIFVDIVSKNGCMLLNVPPKSDGTFDDKTKFLLKELGAWLKINGEAIYATRPFSIYGEGPTKIAKMKSHGFNENNKRVYSSQDIRFTRSKDGETVYAIVLNTPGKEIVIQSINVDQSKDSKLELLGYEGKVNFKINSDKKLIIQTEGIPFEESACKYAYAFKLTGFEIKTVLREKLISPANDGTNPKTAEADLLEGFADRLEFLSYAINDPDFHIWGTSPIIDQDGKVHLFVARWSADLGHMAWKTHCEVAHYVGKGPQGPFEFSDVVVQGSGVEGDWDERSPHNPCIKQIDGKYVLTYIANSGNPFPASQRIGMQIADSLNGPWRKVGETGMILAPSGDPENWTHRSNCGVNNPALTKSLDGRYFLYFKAQTGKERPKKYGLAIADKLEGPYSIQPDPVTSNKGTIEDGYAFTYHDHHFLITTDNHGMIENGGGLLWRSKDGLRFDHVEQGFKGMKAHIPEDMFVKPVWVKGKGSFKFERPQILQIDGVPSYLYLPSHCNLEGHKRSTSFVFKIAPRDSEPPADKPNILFIMLDDLGKEFISCYGSDTVETPNIDKLAAGGLKFNNAYSMAQCTPSRAALLTGKYPYSSGWINHWDVPRWGVGYFDWERETTFARIMKSAGYTTATAGKWQINDFRIEPDAMGKHGFDDWCMWTGFEAGNRASGERYQDPYLHTREGSKTHQGKFGPDVCADFLIEFIRKNKEQPMMLYYPMILTHLPAVATPDEPDAKGTQARFEAMARYMDKIVGRLVAALDETGLRERTIVIFTTDNGSPGSVKAVRHGVTVKGAKGKITEPGLCQPYIVNCPGRVPQGETDVLTAFPDLLPTFAELGGAKLPAGLQLDGKSIAGVILGTDKEGPHDWICGMGHGGAKLTAAGVTTVQNFTHRFIRDKRYKVIVSDERKITALFDLKTDPGEKNNLIDERKAHASVLKKFETILAAMPAKDPSPAYRPRKANPWDRTNKKERKKKNG
jgi:alpha-L-fucosidase/arylsulfatase A-like enzyme